MQFIFLTVATVLSIPVFIMIVIGGYKYILSNGSPERVEKAQKTITAAIMGLVWALGAVLVWWLLLIILGVQ